ncbi:MAG TPA: zf-HC2 domain-containing protein, partial [Gemmatimonadaceae bacterium]|nr:zf-HC2 domain-containing protein [Gemmatimonadaceae bacterium]
HMQHLDEGTIHAWLDGALTADEAARADAHVRECPQCQAAVAEARGFIAASSRILTALDNAPRGVIPEARPARRVQPWVWRVAATVLVVAAGTLILIRPPRATKTANTAAQDLTTEGQLATKIAVAATESTATMQREMRAEGAQGVATTPSAAPAPAAQPPRAFSVTPQATPSRRVAARDQNISAAAGGARVDEVREAPTANSVTALSAPVAAPAPPVAQRALGAVSGSIAETPRQVGMKRQLGKTETFYEIAPGDTVVLEEQFRVELQSVVVTGAGTTTARPMLRTGKAAAATEPQRKTESAASAAPPPPAPPPVIELQDAQTAEIHRISWLDQPSGSVLILSGRHTQEELQQIRQKIQRLRDAAAQSRKPD